jgi:hypothetical protein
MKKVTVLKGEKVYNSYTYFQQFFVGTFSADSKLASKSAFFDTYIEII